MQSSAKEGNSLGWSTNVYNFSKNWHRLSFYTFGWLTSIVGAMPLSSSLNFALRIKDNLSCKWAGNLNVLEFSIKALETPCQQENSVHGDGTNLRCKQHNHIGLWRKWKGTQKMHSLHLKFWLDCFSNDNNTVKLVNYTNNNSSSQHVKLISPTLIHKLRVQARDLILTTKYKFHNTQFTETILRNFMTIFSLMQSFYLLILNE